MSLSSSLSLDCSSAHCVFQFIMWNSRDQIEDCVFQKYYLWISKIFQLNLPYIHKNRSLNNLSTILMMRIVRYYLLITFLDGGWSNQNSKLTRLKMPIFSHMLLEEAVLQCIKIHINAEHLQAIPNIDNTNTKQC